MTDTLIPDISEFQGDVDWPNFGAPIVICRINYGNSKVDAKADRNIDGARSKCIARGWYSYLIQDQDPVAQADVMVRVLKAHGGLRPNEFIVCDDEEGAGDQSPRVNAFLNEVNSQLKTTEDFWYSGLNFSIAHNLAAANGRRWIAAYGVPEPTVPHDLWQFTSSSSIAGVNGSVDMSVFHGDVDQFLSLIGGKGALMALTDTQQQAMYESIIRILSLLANGRQLMEDANGNLIEVPTEWPEWLPTELGNISSKLENVTTPTVDTNALATQLASNSTFVSSLATAIAHVLGSALDKA